MNVTLNFQILKQIKIYVSAKKLPKLIPISQPVRGTASQQLSILSPEGVASSPLVRSGSGFLNIPKTIDIDVPDTGRVEESAVTCDVIFFIGSIWSFFLVIFWLNQRRLDNFHSLEWRSASKSEQIIQNYASNFILFFMHVLC